MSSISESTPVRIPIGQLITILGAIVSTAILGTWVVAKELAQIKSAMDVSNVRIQFQLDANSAALRVIEQDRVAVMRDWGDWKKSVDQTNMRQDGEIRALSNRIPSASRNDQ